MCGQVHARAAGIIRYIDVNANNNCGNSFYNPSAVETALEQMHTDGYNVVRV